MAIKVPDIVLRLLDEIEGSAENILDYEIGSRLSGIHNADGLSAEERKGGWAESAAFNFMPSLGTEPGPWGTFFGPVFSGTKHDGAPFYAPDVAEVDEEIVAHWETRSAAARHPVLRARYSDLVWDLKKQATGEIAAVTFAQRACDAYIEAVSSKLYVESIHAVQYLRRALSIALSINDGDRTRSSKQRMLALVGDIIEPAHVGTWAFVFDDLLENKHVLLEDWEVREIIGILESVLTSCSTMGQGHFDPWAAQAAAERLASYYERRGAKDEVRKVILAYGNAFEQLAAKANPTLAMAWLQPVFDEYRNRGMKADAERVQLASSEKGENARSDLQQFKIPIEFSRDEIEEFLAEVVEGSANDTLMRIAAQFIPKANEARSFLKQVANEHPLIGMIGVTQIADGHFAAKAGSIEQDPEGRLIIQLAESIEWAGLLLNTALSRAMEAHALDSGAILDYLYQSPVFDPERRDLLRSGIDAYLNSDHIKAIHVLIPQIEHSLRRLLALLGGPINKTGRTGTMQVKNLNDILREQRLTDCLGEDLQLYLLTFLADARGQNVRNRITHGLASLSHIDVRIADRIVHVLLAIALVRQQASGTAKPVP